MDTKVIASMLGTDTRVLRRFLRDPKSTFKAVGSGSRYEFTESDLPELTRRFQDWIGNKQPMRPPVTLKVVDSAEEQRKRDMEVWAEEDARRGGPLVMADIRDPKVRRAVRAKADEWDRRLNERLLASGMHISQRRYQAAAA